MTGIAIFAAVFTVETALMNGVKRTETVDVASENNIVRFVWTKDKVPSDFKSVTVTPDFAVAQKGEEGYWVLPDNT